jgi:hypothetical protein
MRTGGGVPPVSRRQRTQAVLGSVSVSEGGRCAVDSINTAAGTRLGSWSCTGAERGQSKRDPARPSRKAWTARRGTSTARAVHSMNIGVGSKFAVDDAEGHGQDLRAPPSPPARHIRDVRGTTPGGAIVAQRNSPKCHAERWCRQKTTGGGEGAALRSPKSPCGCRPQREVVARSRGRLAAQMTTGERYFPASKGRPIGGDHQLSPLERLQSAQSG